MKKTFLSDETLRYSISKQNLVDDIMTDSYIHLSKHAQDMHERHSDMTDSLVYAMKSRAEHERQQRNQSDKLWLLFAKGLALFVIGYMCYHFIRFLMM